MGRQHDAAFGNVGHNDSIGADSRVIANRYITQDFCAGTHIDSVPKRWMTAPLAVARGYHLRPLHEHAVLPDAPVNDHAAKVVDHESGTDFGIERDANAANRLRDLIEDKV